MSTPNFILEQVSPFDVPVTVEKIIEAATRMEWQIPAVHNLQQSLAKSGKEVRPVQVVEICKPAYSGRMLEHDAERIVSVMMPCRISVYEKSDGKAYVALLDMGTMADGLSSLAKEAVMGASNESMQIVKSVIGLTA